MSAVTGSLFAAAFTAEDRAAAVNKLIAHLVDGRAEISDAYKQGARAFLEMRAQIQPAPHECPFAEFTREAVDWNRGVCDAFALVCRLAQRVKAADVREAATC